MDGILEISLRSLLENAHMGVVIHRWDTTVVYANPASLRLLRLRYDQLVGKDALNPDWHFVDGRMHRLPPDDYPVNKVRRSGERLKSEIVGVMDGQSPDVTWFNVNAYPEGNGSGKHGFIVVVFAEINAERFGFSFRDIVENANDMVVVTEAEDIDAPSGPRIVYVNRAFEVETGHAAEEVIGETPRILQGSLTSAAARQRIREHLIQRTPVRETLLNYTKGGVPYWVEVNIVPLRDRNGEVTHFAAIERNISEQTFRAEQLERRNEDLRQLKENLRGLVEQRTQELQEANRKLEHLAYVDPLTQVPNRRSFIEQAKLQWARAQRDRRRVLVGILDLDHFKQVNDRHGHAAGDDLLVLLANCLSGFFRREDAYGRIGGEEFAFCILLGDDAEAMAIGERLRERVGALVLPLAEGRTLAVTASLGLAVCDASASDLSTALVDADAALYQAKSQGRNACVLAGERAGPEVPRPD